MATRLVSRAGRPMSRWEKPCLALPLMTPYLPSDDRFTVLGSGAVYVMDRTGISYSSLSERHTRGVVSIYNVRLHVLAEGDQFDLGRKQPVLPAQD